VVIGVNQFGTDVKIPPLRYAEDDARALYDLLTDRAIGTFSREEAVLLTGADAEARRVKTLLREIVVDATPADVLLVYFAGHAFVPEWGRPSDAYLVTPDLNVDALRTDPDAGLRMAFLKRDIFALFEGPSFLVLDCCRAGAYINSDLRTLDAIASYGPQIEGHSALLSCPSDAVARESHDLRHGVLTHHMLRALRGAVVDADGRVSFAQMTNFVLDQGIDPTPGQIMQLWGPTTVLTQPSASGFQLKKPLTQPVTVSSCENPLDRHLPAIGQFLDRVFRSGWWARRLGRMEGIRHAIDAEAIAQVEFSDAGVTVLDHTARFNTDELRPLLEESGERAFPADPLRLGYAASDEAGRRILFVPVRQDDTRSLVLAVAGLPPSLLDLGEPLVELLRAVWKVDIAEDPQQAEVRALTALRSRFGRLPVTLYDRCFRLYQNLIDSLFMVFQPVITLSPRPAGVGIHSYEALARRGEGDTRAPTSVLHVAYVWGERFITERDAILLGKAITSYSEADATNPWDGTKPISVNVAVRSLLSDSYLGVLRSVLDESNIDPSKVTLEISEHDPIRPGPDEVWPEEPLKYFHNRLTYLARELDISFAVDDFGVGYSSLARMAELPLTQIKVDRAVLHHPLALDELSLVMEVARHSLGPAPAPRAVIVEGFDGAAPVTLQQLYERRIRHVQGYISGEPASTSLHPLDNSVRNRIAASVRGADDQRESPGTARDRR